MILYLENVRSFRGPHSIPIAPITLLVGENSAGKTTLLSMLAAAWSPDFPGRSSFRNPPFDLGSFDTIATYAGGRWRSRSFSVGFTDDSIGESLNHIRATFEDSKGQPVVVALEARSSRGSLFLRVEGNTLHASISPTAPRESLNVSIPMPPDSVLTSESATPLLLRAVSHAERGKGQEKPERIASLFPLMFELLQAAYRQAPALAIAPVRTKPRRTYDELLEDFKPEGDHVPLILARAWDTPTNPQRRRLETALKQFGEESGLFDEISVKRFGKRSNAPFQISVRLHGPPVNLPDVGYGVSQSLPVIVESVLAAKERRLILQQPEVHLHPRAQAALGSFFARLAKSEKKQFVIETHSDFLVDRVRQEVAKGTLEAKDVLILFFDRQGYETRVSAISVDSLGNVANAPPGYRRFFLEEELNLISRGGQHAANS